jgi:putative membrane protein
MINEDNSSERPAEDATTSEQSLVSSRGPSDYVVIALKGFACGCGVIPGVSGGTMAFILGIFEELIESIRRVSEPAFLRAVLTLQWKRAIEIGNVKFLAAIGVGSGVAILTLARLLEWMLINEPLFLWSFFFGLILASVVVVGKRIRSWRGGAVPALVAGTVGAWYFVGLVPLETPETWWFYILSGALAIWAMILPGISGAFVLVLLGKYQTVLSAVNHARLDIIALVGIGTVVGIVLFAKVLTWFFKHHHDVTVAVLTGFVLGSLRKVWPWKETVTTYVDRHGREVPALVNNVLPAMGPEVGWAVVLALAGLAAILMMDRAHVTDESMKGH